MKPYTYLQCCQTYEFIRILHGFLKLEEKCVRISKEFVQIFCEWGTWKLFEGHLTHATSKTLASFSFIHEPGFSGYITIIFISSVSLIKCDPGTYSQLKNWFLNQFYIRWGFKKKKKIMSITLIIYYSSLLLWRKTSTYTKFVLYPKKTLKKWIFENSIWQHWKYHLSGFHRCPPSV